MHHAVLFLPALVSVCFLFSVSSVFLSKLVSVMGSVAGTVQRYRFGSPYTIISLVRSRAGMRSAMTKLHQQGHTVYRAVASQVHLQDRDDKARHDGELGRRPRRRRRITSQPYHHGEAIHILFLLYENDDQQER